MPIPLLGFARPGPGGGRIGHRVHFNLHSLLYILRIHCLCQEENSHNHNFYGMSLKFLLAGPIPTFIDVTNLVKTALATRTRDVLKELLLGGDIIQYEIECFHLIITMVGLDENVCLHALLLQA